MIHARGLTREFRVGKETVEAVRGLDIDVGAGELVAFLGPNGAGKSTSLRMLTTLLPPTAGEATVAGHDIRRDPAAVRRRIGYVGQGHGASDDQRGRDELVAQGRAYGLSGRRARERADELIESMDLAAVATRTANTLSGGQRRRLDIAIGLVHEPTLLFLDEPSTGLDPQSRANLWDHLVRLRETHDTTIFLTTHYLDEADAMAERVVVIDHGRVIADGTPETLKQGMAGDRVAIGVGDPAAAGRAAAIAQRVIGTNDATTDGSMVRLRAADGASAVPSLLRSLERAGIPATSVEVRRPTLDDVFLELTGRSLRDEGDLTATRPAASASTNQTLEVAS
jgi:ABC-2 type transport system ATP-binding protein